VSRSNYVYVKVASLDHIAYNTSYVYVVSMQRTFYTSYQIHLYSSFRCDDNNAATKLCKSLIAKTALINMTFIRAIYNHDGSISIYMYAELSNLQL